MKLFLQTGRPVAQLQQEIDSQHFTELLAYDRYIEPFGGEWRQVGMLAAVVAGLASSKGKRPTPEDFMPLLKVRPGREQGKRIEGIFKAFAKEHNEKLKAKKK